LTEKQKSTAEVEKSEADSNNRPLERKEELHSSATFVPLQLPKFLCVWNSRAGGNFQSPWAWARETSRSWSCRDKPHGRRV